MLIGFAGLGDSTGDQAITCPPGYSVNAANVGGQDQVWCENAQGQRVSATATPIDDSIKPSKGIGVVGWSLIVGVSVIGAAWLLAPKRGRR